MQDLAEKDKTINQQEETITDLNEDIAQLKTTTTTTTTKSTNSFPGITGVQLRVSQKKFLIKIKASSKASLKYFQIRVVGGNGGK